MKTFVVLSCLLAVACGLGAPYPGGHGQGFGASRYGGSSFSQQQQQSHSESSHRSIQQSSSSVGGASSLIGGSGIGGIGGESFGHGGAISAIGGESFGHGASAFDAHSIGSRSSAFGAESAIADASYATGGLSELHGAGLSGAAIHGADLHGAGLSGAGLGHGLSSVSGGALSRQHSSSVSRSFSSSSSSSSYANQVVNYQEAWPQLYQVPLFQRLCNLKSTLRSEELTNTFVQRGFDYGSQFSDLYSKNALLQKYFYTATGIRYTENRRRDYYSLINQNPTQALRLATIFARNPNIFTSNFGQFIIGGSSLELLQGYQRGISTYSADVFSSSKFLNSLVRSKYYGRSLSRFYGLRSYDQQQLLHRISSSYRTNSYGTLLALRHVLARRKLYDYNTYYNINSFDAYRSQYDSVWSRKSWRHNDYFNSWKQSSFSRSSSFSSHQSSASRSFGRASSSSALGGLSSGGFGHDF